jgi:hypothetical protein
MKYNQDFSGIAIADEIINRASSTAAALVHDTILDDSSIEIWTGAGGTGTQLTEGVDFTLNDIDSDLTTEAGADIYLTMAIINGTYHSTDIYVSYKTVGDFNDAADVNDLASDINTLQSDYFVFEDFDISSADQSYTIPSASDNAKRAIRISWSGGDGTYDLTITGTINGYSSWVGQGNGSITIHSDGSAWYADNEGVFDSGLWTTGYFEKSISGKLKQRFNESTAVLTSTNIVGSYYTTATATYTYPIAFNSIEQIFAVGMQRDTGQNSYYLGGNTTSVSTTQVTCSIYGVNAGQYVARGYKAVGRWRA